MLTLHSTQCCGVQEIGCLRLFQDPKAAMMSFCSQACTSPENPYVGRATTKNRKPLAAFYTFTAYNASHQVEHQYGPRFEAFIKEQNLGEVYPAQARDNLKNYGKNHPVQIWIWAPDYDAVYDWWEKNDPSKVKRFVAEAPKPKRSYKATKVDGMFVITEVSRTTKPTSYRVIPNKGSIYGKIKG